MQQNQNQNQLNKRAYVHTGYLNSNSYIAGSSHNLYSDYSDNKYKIHALHNASSDPWNDERIKATLWPERKEEIVESIFEAVIYALFGAMIVLAYLT